MKYKIIRLDMDTGEAKVAKTMENATEEMAKSRVAGFNRLANKVLHKNTWVYCYVEER